MERATRTRMAASTTLLACVLAGALLAAGPASASSRGFRLYNRGRSDLRLESVSTLPMYVCDPTLCVPNHFRIGFEGRPHIGAVLHPHETHAWELKWGYPDISHWTQYAAVLKYQIVGTDDTVEYTIETTPLQNNSACKVIPANAGYCFAAGLNLSFERSR